MSGEAAIEVSGLDIVRGGRAVLHSVSLRVRPDLVTGLLGPSGCGKTTLMRSIVGAQIVESGSVGVLGQAAGSPDLRPLIGYVTQAPSVYEDLTVYENLAYFARIVGVGRARIDETLKTVTSARCETASSDLSPKASGPGSPWPAPCSTVPDCSSSTSRRSASTRC